MKTYYWRVDQLDENSDLVSKGSVWRFSTVECIMIDDFESYDNDGNDIGDVWFDKLDNDEMYIVLQDSLGLSPTNSMELGYQVLDEPFYTIAARSFSQAQDWTVGGVEVLTIHCYIEPAIFGLPMFVTVGDGINDANVAVKYFNTIGTWQEVNVDLSEIAAAGVDLNNVSYMEIGFGDGTDWGMIYRNWDYMWFDDIALYRPE